MIIAWEEADDFSARWPRELGEGMHGSAFFG
jgi:hypothetical protein